MCNRIRSIQAWERLRRNNLPPLPATLPNHDPSLNVAPTETTPSLIVRDGKTVAVLARFGITWPATARPPLLNARADSLRRGSFRSLGRAIVPVDGFYEWRNEGGAKQPYMFQRKDGEPLLIAAIWDDAEYKGDRRPAFALVTEEPNALIAPYHDRMVICLADEHVAPWLAGDAGPTVELALPLEAFAVRKMNRALNSVKEKSADKIEADPE